MTQPDLSPPAWHSRWCRSGHWRPSLEKNSRNPPPSALMERMARSDSCLGEVWSTVTSTALMASPSHQISSFPNSCSPCPGTSCVSVGPIRPTPACAPRLSFSDICFRVVCSFCGCSCIRRRTMVIMDKSWIVWNGPVRVDQLSR